MDPQVSSVMSGPSGGSSEGMDDESPGMVLKPYK